MRLPVFLRLPEATAQWSPRHYALLFALSLALLALLPRPYSSLLLAGVMIGSAWLAAREFHLRERLEKARITPRHYAIVFTLTLPFMILLPRPYSAYLLGAVVLGSIGLALRLTNWDPHMDRLERLWRWVRAGRMTPRRYAGLLAISAIGMILLPRPQNSYVLAGVLLLSLRLALPRIRWPRFTRWHYLVLFALSLLVMANLPRPLSSYFLGVVVAGSITLAAVSELVSRRQIGFGQALTFPLRWLWTRPKAFEVSLILVALWIATGHLRDWSPELRIDGAELSYLLNSGIIAGEVLQRTGSIPLWNPFMGSGGEPLLENPFSFVLNPLMSVPVMALGFVQGPKVGLLIHVVLLGLGGWALADQIGLRTPGRVLLALLLGGAGSVTGMMGKGFYQMALSLAYVPWVLTGLLGTLRGSGRRSTAILVVSSALMIFAGTFWYVLPTAIGAGLLTLVTVVQRQANRFTLDAAALRRLLLAGVLLLGLSAVRLLPQIAHHNLVEHPREYFDWEPFPFMGMFVQYFKPVTYTGTMNDQAIFFHHTLPLAFAFFLVGMSVVTVGLEPLRKRWRIVIPAAFLLLFFTVWAQGGVPIIRWLYFNFTLLMQWRFVSRMMAAGGLWVAVLAAIWFDAILLALWRRIVAASKRPGFRALPTYIASGLLMVSTLGAGVIASIDILHNWQRTVGLMPLYSYDRMPLVYLRAQHPNEFIAAYTPGFFRYEPFYDLLVRASFGNPDYRPAGMPSTVGSRGLWYFPAEYAWGIDENFQYNPAEQGYVPLPGSEAHFGQQIIWRHPDTPPYAFIISPARADASDEPLTLADVTPVPDFSHHIEQIHVTVENYKFGTLLALQEVAYPGWRVAINGKEAQVESLGGNLAVYLPDQFEPANVVFWYDPVWLYAGAGITVLSVLIFAAYVLRSAPFSPENAADRS